MRKIFKYTVPPRDLVVNLASGNYTDAELEVEMPVGSIGMRVDIQSNDLVIWALVDPNETIKKISKYRIVGTGHELPDDWASKWMYVTTLFTGPFVWHVWEYWT